MTNSVKTSPKKSYYLPGDPSRTPLSHDEFCDIMRPFWKERKRLERAGLCKPPARHACMCDCADCPYSRRGNTLDMDTLELIGKEIADPACMEESVANRIFEQQIYRCLPQMDTIDRIIIRCLVLHEREVTERQLAALITKAIGQNYSHQAVHKRIPAAAKRLAALMNYNPYE